MPLPPRDVFAAATRQAVEELHTDWDSPHSFQTLHWNGEKLHTGTYACVMPDINPDDYPALMIGIAREQQEKHPEDPAYAYLLQCESFGVTMPVREKMSVTEQMQFDADRLGRTFRKRPDAVESCTAWCADIHGRLWCASKVRSEPGHISESFYPSGQVKLGGQFIRGLLSVAYTTGMMYHGLPGPPSMAN